jgi:antitoxin (DNA-binding transcriptional repressor) of toxin-antitoxin stability system
MTSLTIRDLRQRWPEAEKALETEEEIIITRDGKPVAKLVPFVRPQQTRPHFDPDKHFTRLKKILGGRMLPNSDEGLAKRRADRFGRE